MEPSARSFSLLLEPVHLVSYMSPEPTEALRALGLRNYWDGYFASRAAPLGRVPAEVVHAAFYNFGPGEAARHIPRVWELTTPEEALAARERDPSDKRQEELFRLAYPVGGTVSLTVPDGDGERVERDARISRIGRSLRQGWPQAKLGLSVYAEDWENSEFPATFAVKGSDKVAAVALDATGASAQDASGAPVWSAPWSRLRFSNGSDIILNDGAGRAIHVEYPADQPALEEILIKYGTLKQMHF